MKNKIIDVNEKIVVKDIVSDTFSNFENIHFIKKLNRFTANNGKKVSLYHVSAENNGDLLLDYEYFIAIDDSNDEFIGGFSLIPWKLRQDIYYIENFDHNHKFMIPEKWQKNGIGTAILKEITSFADKYRVTLNIIDFVNEAWEATCSRFGFIEEDHTYIRIPSSK